jgi:hypothetical protein
MMEPPSPSLPLSPANAGVHSRPGRESGTEQRNDRYGPRLPPGRAGEIGSTANIPSHVARTVQSSYI